MMDIAAHVSIIQSGRKMTEYNPDSWIVLKMNYKDQIIYKVLGGWSGAYIQGSSWRLNSGITGCTESEYHYIFTGYSGSTYQCSKFSYGLRINNAYIFDKFQKQLGQKHFILMPEDTNWLEMDWGLK